MAKSKIPDFSKGKRFYLLPDRLPEIFNTSPTQIRNINRDLKIHFQPDFFYSGAGLLSSEGKQVAATLRQSAGKCLGGGVFASRDLEWFANGKVGQQPGQFYPTKTLFGYSKDPQSFLPSEWIACEYALALRPPYGPVLLSSWDDVYAMAKTIKQGKDLHVRIDGNFGSGISQINAQANALSIINLLEIAAHAGVPTYD